MTAFVCEVIETNSCVRVCVKHTYEHIYSSSKSTKEVIALPHTASDEIEEMRLSIGGT